MMVCNTLYSHEANDDLSLQQGWDTGTCQFQDSWARKSDSQEAERYLREEQADQKYHQEKLRENREVGRTENYQKLPWKGKSCN